MPTRFIRTLSCYRSRRHIDQWIDLTTAQRTAIRQHARACPHCEATLAATLTLVQRLEAGQSAYQTLSYAGPPLQHARLQHNRPKQRRPARLSLATAGVAAMLIAILFIALPGSPPPAAPELSLDLPARPTGGALVPPQGLRLAQPVALKKPSGLRLRLRRPAPPSEA